MSNAVSEKLLSLSTHLNPLPAGGARRRSASADFIELSEFGKTDNRLEAIFQR
jgi:hypothetical protein